MSVTDAITKPDGTPPTYTPEQRDLIKRTVFQGSSDDELSLYLHDCQRQGVHPLDRLIHPTIRTYKGQRKYTAITSIDLMRSRAGDTGDHAGTDDVVYGPDDERGHPAQATVTVYRVVAGQRVPFTATARWAEYKPDPPSDMMWNRMPRLMLGKVAEALALRKAFPRVLSGLYAQEEMDQADNRAPVRRDPSPLPPEGMAVLRRHLIARVQEAKREIPETVKSAALALGLSGKTWAEYTDEELKRLLDAVNEQADADQSGDANEDFPPPALPESPALGGSFVRSIALAYMVRPTMANRVNEAQQALGMGPTPLSRLSDGALADIYELVRKP